MIHTDQDNLPPLHMRFTLPFGVEIKKKNLEYLKHDVEEYLSKFRDGTKDLKVSSTALTLTLLDRSKEGKIVKEIKQLFHQYL